jgi:hypothetical protein
VIQTLHRERLLELAVHNENIFDEMGDRGWIISAPKRSASVIPGGWWNIGGVILNAHCKHPGGQREKKQSRT